MRELWRRPPPFREPEAERTRAEFPRGSGPAEMLRLQRLAGNQAVGRMLQRSVGFEFETGWLVHKKGRMWGQSPLAKKDPVGTGPLDGYKIEADEAGAGESELEFIVHPPIDEDAAGVQRLGEVMGAMTALGTVLEAQAGKSQLKQFPLGQATGRPADDEFLITPAGAKLRAGAQVTSGLDLAKISQLATLSQETPAPPELAGTVQQLQGQAGKVTARAGPLSPALQGMLTVITQYIEAGAYKYRGEQLDADDRHKVALNYPKRVADLLLARTDFARLFEMLPRPEGEYYASRPLEFVALVLQAVDPALHVQEDHPVFARGIQNDEEDFTKGVTVPELTVGDWLYGIPHGFDVLTTVPDAESMGEFGSRTEPVGPKATGYGTFPRDRLQAGIFEFRGAQSQHLQLERWGPFALEFLAFIANVHASKAPAAADREPEREPLLA